MNWPRKTKWTLSLVWCALLLNCATTQPPDVPACMHLSAALVSDPQTQSAVLKPSPACEKAIGEPECGYCVYIVSGKKIFIGEKKENRFNGKSWSTIKEESVLLPSQESFAPLWAYLMQVCKQLECSEEITKLKVPFGGEGPK